MPLPLAWTVRQASLASDNGLKRARVCTHTHTHVCLHTPKEEEGGWKCSCTATGLNSKSPNPYATASHAFALQLMGIVIKGLKVTTNTLREGILNVDPALVQEEHLQNILNVLPTQDEVRFS